MFVSLSVVRMILKSVYYRFRISVRWLWAEHNAHKLLNVSNVKGKSLKTNAVFFFFNLTFSDKRMLVEKQSSLGSSNSWGKNVVIYKINCQSKYWTGKRNTFWICPFFQLNTNLITAVNVLCFCRRGLFWLQRTICEGAAITESGLS